MAIFIIWDANKLEGKGNLNDKCLNKQNESLRLTTAFKIFLPSSTKHQSQSLNCTCTPRFVDDVYFVVAQGVRDDNRNLLTVMQR